MDFTDQLEGLLEDVEKLVPTTIQRQAMTKKAADVYCQELRDVTKQKHYSSHHDQKYGHMADHIDVANTELDGTVNGNSVVGWDNRYHAANARRLNDGTKHYSADHFVTAVQQSTEIHKKMLEAELEVYRKITGGGP